MPRNSLNDGNQPFEPGKRKKINNLLTRKMVRLVNQNGDTQEFDIEEKVSSPNDNGTYVDSEVHSVHLDHAGNTLPEDLRSFSISHSGTITSEKSKANCSHWLHFNGSRIIHIGQDGRLTPNGVAICSRCASRMRFIYLIAGILGFGVVFGLYKGVGLF